MKLEIIKGFNNEVRNKYYTMYDNVSLKNTHIFIDIKFHLCYETKFEDIKDIINTIKANSRSKCEVYFYDDRIEIFKPNKYIFPEILIIKNEL